jgi:hypothetical protein
VEYKKQCSVCNEFELTFEPDDGHIGLTYEVQQKDTSEQ